MEFTARQLRAVLLIAEHGSFSRAAEALFVTPSGISVIIRELESQLGFRVFDRTTRHVALTRRGQSLVPLVRRLVDDLESTVSSLGRSASTERQSVSMGAPPLVAAELVVPAIHEFHLQHPDMRVRLFDKDMAAIASAIQAGEIELGVTAGGPGLRGIRLFRYSFVFIRPAGPGAVQRASVTWSAAAAEPLVVQPATSPAQHIIDRHLSRVRVRHPDTIVVTSLNTQIAMVEAGEGAAIIPSFGLPVSRRRNVLTSRLVNPVVTAEFYLSWSRATRLSPAAQAFAAVLQRHVARWSGVVGIS